MDSEHPNLNHAPQNVGHRTLRRLFFLTMILWCALPLSPQSVDSDFWGHARYGWDTWHRGLAREATYTYTAVGHRWINHENLSELIMAGCAFGIGPSSLLALKCVLGCLILGLAVASVERGRFRVHPLTMALVCVIASINLSFYWGLRPHLFTFVFFALLIALTDWCFDGWSGQAHLARTNSQQNSWQLNWRRLHYLWLAPILLAVWANTHGGFLAGVAVFGVLMSGRAIEVLCVQGFGAWKTIVYFAVLALAGAAATLLNPYGLELHRWLIESLSVPRPEIQEWHPPDWFGPASLKLWAMFGLLGWGLVASRRPRDIGRLLVLSVVLFEAYQHQRHLPFVAILMLFWLPAHLQSAIDRLPLRRPIFTQPAAPAWTRLAIITLISLSSLLAYRVGSRLSGVPVSNHEYPVDALQFMADQGLTGRLIVDGHWAQYVLGVMGAYSPGDPGVLVCFDGRFRTCYPQQVVDMFFDFFIGDGGPEKRYRSPASSAADAKKILSFHDPQLVLINRHSAHPVAVMNGLHKEWSLLYQDQLAQLWGRRTEFDRPDAVATIPSESVLLTRANPAKVYWWPAAPYARRQPELVWTSRDEAKPQHKQAR